MTPSAVYIYSPRRISGGGATFIAEITRALEAIDTQVHIVHRRRAIPRGQPILAIGTRTPWFRRRVTFWPLTVAPLEQDTIELLAHNARTRLRWRLLRLIIGANSLFAHQLIFSSEYARSIYLRHFPWLRRRTTIVLLPSPSIAPRKESRIAPDDDSFEMLFVSHLYPYKLAHVAIQALPRLTAEIPAHINLTFAGAIPNSQYDHYLHELVSDLNVESNVTFAGSLPNDELRDLYNNSDLFIFTSVSENAGSYALIDALASGLPIVCSNVGSMPEICGDAVRYVSPRDDQAISRSILSLYASEDTRNMLSRRALQRSRELPTWSQTAAHLRDFLLPSQSY